MIWGGVCQTHIKSLVILQERIIRINSYQSYLVNTNYIFYLQGVLKITDINKYLIAFCMFKNVDTFDAFQTITIALEVNFHSVPNFNVLLLLRKVSHTTAPKPGTLYLIPYKCTLTLRVLKLNLRKTFTFPLSSISPKTLYVMSLSDMITTKYGIVNLGYRTHYSLDIFY